MSACTPNRDVFFKFFPSDWRGDEELAMCSLAARGLWVELMCVAHKNGGYVRIHGGVPSLDELAQVARAKPADVRKHLEELKLKGVCSVAEDGTIFSRRMVRDAARRVVNQENGRRGGSPILANSVNRSDNRQVNQIGKRKSNPYSKPELEPEPEPELEPETKNVSSATAQTADAEPPPALLTFPTIGSGPKTWALVQRLVDEWAAAYPGIDVLGECRKAHAWVRANRPKTAKGMPAFLVRWLNKAADSSRGLQSTAAVSAPRPMRDQIAEYRKEFGKASA